MLFTSVTKNVNCNTPIYRLEEPYNKCLEMIIEKVLVIMTPLLFLLVTANLEQSRSHKLDV